jgi:hypothetical protein
VTAKLTTCAGAGLDYGLPWLGLLPTAPRSPSQVELRGGVAAVGLLLLGSAFVHSLGPLAADLGLPPFFAEAAPAWSGGEGVSFAAHTVAAAVVLALPGAAATTVHWLAQVQHAAGHVREGLKGWTAATYGYLPLAWGGLTGQWLRLGLTEGLTVPSRLAIMLSGSGVGAVPPSVSHDAAAAVGAGLALGSLLVSWMLTEKLCRENGMATTVAGAHLVLQGGLAAELLHLMR